MTSFRSPSVAWPFLLALTVVPASRVQAAPPQPPGATASAPLPSRPDRLPYGRFSVLLEASHGNPWRPAVTALEPSGALACLDPQAGLRELDLATGALTVSPLSSIAGGSALEGGHPMALRALRHTSPQFPAGTLLFAVDDGLYALVRSPHGRGFVRVGKPAECMFARHMLELEDGSILMAGGDCLFRLDLDGGAAKLVAGSPTLPEGSLDPADLLRTSFKGVSAMVPGTGGSVYIQRIGRARLLRIGFHPAHAAAVLPELLADGGALERALYGNFLVEPGGTLVTQNMEAGGSPLIRVNPLTGATEDAWRFPERHEPYSCEAVAALPDGSLVLKVVGSSSSHFRADLALISPDDALQKELQALVAKGLRALDGHDPAGLRAALDALHGLESPGLDPALRADLADKVSRDPAALIAEYAQPDFTTRLRARLARQYLEQARHP